MALAEYGIPDRVLSRSEVADLPAVDCTAETIRRWEEETEEARPLFPGAIDHPKSVKYPPHSVLAFLARRARGSRDGDAGNHQHQNQEPTQEEGRLALSNLEENWREARDVEQ